MAAMMTFVLAAPLGAMGSLAVGERRGSWDRPGRSAVLGLIAGGLGLDRTDETSHAALSAGLGIAVRREGAVTPMLSDYHTAQTAPTRRNRAFANRREELAAPDPQTILSRRDYRADTAFTVVLWRRPAVSPWTLEDLAAALKKPRFVPYLGRKSCPLGLPMAPVIVDAETIRDALNQRDSVALRIERSMLEKPSDGMVWADMRDGDPALGLQDTHNETRRDEPLSRARWQFGLRDEVAAPWPGRPA